MNDKEALVQPPAQAANITSSPSSGKVFDTRVAGRDETGLTVIEPTGKAVFIPESPTSATEGAPPVAPSDLRLATDVPITALYPHWQEGQADAGVALRGISQAIADLDRAIDLSGDNNPQFLNLLVLAEAQLFKALPKTRFNKALELVVRFSAWALRNAELSDPQTLSLEAMCAVLRELEEQPFLDIRRATNLLTQLEKRGWSGVSPISKLLEEGLSAFDGAEQQEDGA